MSEIFKVIQVEDVEVNSLFYIIEVFDKSIEKTIDNFFIISSADTNKVDLKNAQDWAWNKAHDFIHRRNIFNNKDIFADTHNLRVIVTPVRKMQ
jgi:broad-specificity NMP kinase